MSFINEIDRLIHVIDNGLKEILFKDILYQEKIFDSIEYSLFTGGKRLRPIMALKTFEMYNEDYKKALPFACGIEMIHTYSLIHDDLPAMDDDDFRRGKPTNHKVFGEAMAILAGDGLLNMAFETMSDYIVNHLETLEEYKIYTRAMKEISKYSGVHGMIGGQVVDLLGSHDNMTEDKLMYMYKTKTAALIQSSIVTGAILGGASEKDIEILREFGLNLGLAYQIRDDLLDYKEDSMIEKFTYLTYYNKEKALEEVELMSNRALTLLDRLEDRDTKFLKDLTNYLIDRKV